MSVCYGGRRAKPSYVCSRATTTYGEPGCQGVTAGCVDALVAEQLLAAVAPAALEASLAAVAAVQRDRAALEQQWRLRRERAGYDAGRAARQYQACEPENRLVARELERRWEEALAEQRKLEDEYQRWQRAAPVRTTAADERAIRSLAADLPAVWHAPTTTPADRQRIARLLLERVVVTVDKGSERVDVELHWLGGLVRAHAVTRPVTRYECRADYPRLVARLRVLHGEGFRAGVIADRLNAEGFRPPRRGNRFKTTIVLWLMEKIGLARRERYGSTTGLVRDEYRPMGLARRLGVSRDAVRRWVRSGYVTTRPDADGHHVIWADAAELRRLRALDRANKVGATSSRLAKLRTPSPRPES